MKARAKTRKAATRQRTTARATLALAEADAARLLRQRRAARARRRDATARLARAGVRRTDVAGALLLAEGDSWFDYPFADVLGMLEDLFGYRIESVARKGDTVESMAYDADQKSKLVRKLEHLAADGRRPEAILLSGGGNDLAGPELAVMLNHAQAQLGPLNESIMTGVLDERLYHAVLKLVGTVSALYRSHFGEPPRVFLHGYDYPVPDGRGYAGGAWILPGPWLEPSFRRKGHAAVARNVEVMRTLIDRFNRMMRRVADTPGLAHVTYVDLRGLLSTALPGDAYQKWWANELHPTEAGFEAIARRLHEKLQRR